MRSNLYTDAYATDLATGNVELALLVEAAFTGGTVRLTTAGRDLEDFDSPPSLYLASGHLGEFQTIESKASELPGVQFVLSGVDTAIVAIALGQNVRGRPLRLRLAVMNKTTQQVRAIEQLWAGQIASMPIQQSGGTATVTVIGESIGTIFARPKPIRYTDADQRKLYPTDECLRYIVSQARKQDVWPAVSFYRK